MKTNSEIIAEMEKEIDSSEIGDEEDHKLALIHALDKARASGLPSNHENPKDFQAFSAKLKNSRDEAVAELDKVIEESMRLDALKISPRTRGEIEQCFIRNYIAARNSALAEIERLKKTNMELASSYDILKVALEDTEKQLNKKDKEVAEKKKDIERLAINEVNKLKNELSQFRQTLDDVQLEKTYLQNENSKLRDGVGKLKADVQGAIDFIDNKGLVPSTFDSGKLNGLCFVKDKLNEIFPSCAEQPNVKGEKDAKN